MNRKFRKVNTKFRKTNHDRIKKGVKSLTPETHIYEKFAVAIHIETITLTGFRTLKFYQVTFYK